STVLERCRFRCFYLRVRCVGHLHKQKTLAFVSTYSQAEVVATLAPEGDIHAGTAPGPGATRAVVPRYVVGPSSVRTLVATHRSAEFEKRLVVKAIRLKLWYHLPLLCMDRHCSCSVLT